jgi:hypothetical protein
MSVSIIGRVSARAHVHVLFILSLPIHCHLFVSARVPLVIKSMETASIPRFSVLRLPQDVGGTESKR